jgi:hypothetical protein
VFQKKKERRVVGVLSANCSFAILQHKNMRVQSRLGQSRQATEDIAHASQGCKVQAAYLHVHARVVGLSLLRFAGDRAFRFARKQSTSFFILATPTS